MLNDMQHYKKIKLEKRRGKWAFVMDSTTNDIYIYSFSVFAYERLDDGEKKRDTFNVKISS